MQVWSALGKDSRRYRVVFHLFAPTAFNSVIRQSMSASDFRMTGSQMVCWGVMLLGLYGAYSAGQTLGEGDFSHVIFYILTIIWLLAALIARHIWWIALFFSLGLGLTTAAGGFKMSGTDIAGLFSLSCLLAMSGMNQLSVKKKEMNLGGFFYLTLIYVAFHTSFFMVDNYYGGDTQFKNIAKLYYSVLIPLGFLWLMDRYAEPNGISVALKLLIYSSLLFSIIGIAVTITGFSISLLCTDIMFFSWASNEMAIGYLRWTTLPILLLCFALYFMAATLIQKTLNTLAIGIFLVGMLLSGGRIAALETLLFFVPWLAIRGEKRKIYAGAWFFAIVFASLFTIGHTIDPQRLENLPESFQSVQRSLSLFLPSEKSENLKMEGSDAWHKDLVIGSWNYAHNNFITMITGNGFKGWDDSIDISMFTFGAAYDFAVKIAIRMGQSETLFFSVLPIFGWLGVFLYYGFMFEMMRRYVKVRKICPAGSLARALCEFSFSYIFITMVVSPFGGAIPSYNMIFWIIGFIAAKPYMTTRFPFQKPVSLSESTEVLTRGPLVKTT